MRISFKSFIGQAKNSTSKLNNTIDTTLAESHVACFVAQEKHILLFSQLRNYAQSSISIPVEIVDAKQAGYESIKLFLQTTFLGMKKIYFFHGIDDLNSSQKKDLLSYFSQYNGPNQLYFFTSSDVDSAMSKKLLIVDVPQTINQELFSELISWYKIEYNARAKQFVAQLFENRTAIPADMACLLINYLQVLGGNSKDFFTQWLDLIVPPDQSLFVLSQYFFKKNKKAFFEQWLAVKDAYAPPFWVSFWSEQLWRASMFIALNQKQQRSQARAISFRLPFSFINYDWKKYTAVDLIKAHDFIYTIDYRIKNSSGDSSFDLFYSQFFLDGFSGQ